MVKAKDKVYDAADSVKPYVERAMHDEQLRGEVLSAFAAAKDLYHELAGSKSAAAAAAKAATDDDVHEKLRDAVNDLRSAAERLQGRRPKAGGGKKKLLIAGLALGILYNPVTGAETRRWVTDLISGGHDDTTSPGGTPPTGSANGSPGS
jgi:hypothetical protein